MPTCVFKTNELIRSVEHALAATQFDMAFETAMAGPRLLFVHDQGVYIMSNGIPRDIISVSNDGAGGEESNYTSYAEGCDPRIGTFDEWYGTSRELVGGDDFVETINIDQDFLDKCREYDELHVNLSPTQMAVLFANRRPAPQNA